MGTSVTEVSEAFVDRISAVDPVRASRVMGLARGAAYLTDYSPEGQAAIAAVYRSTLADLRSVAPEDEAERLGAGYLEDLATAQLDLIESGEPHRLVSASAGPPAWIRMSFDVMRQEDDEDWAVVASRLEDVPRALSGYRAALQASSERGRASSQRLVAEVARQCDGWGRGWFDSYVSRYGEGALNRRLSKAAAAASDAYSGLAAWLRDDYHAHAEPRDGVGAERYRVWARVMLGTNLDVEEAYTWAAEELARIEAEQRRESDRILPGGSFLEVVAHLDAEGEIVEGADAYRGRLQELVDEAIDRLEGVEFDIASELRTCVVGIPPEGTAPAPYYSPPSEDLRSPGTTWFPTRGQTRFPMWNSYTTAYHEAVPGHHLQLGLTRLLPLVRAQRVGLNSAHAEGWALYAERLMDELGWFRTPATRLGFLAMQAFRAARVVIDIGLHTGRDGWTYERAVEELMRVGGCDRGFAEGEALRYLSWPSQATSYKLGERAWLSGRSQAVATRGSSFDRKSWHNRALALGPLGLDRLERELTQLG